MIRELKENYFKGTIIATFHILMVAKMYSQRSTDSLFCYLSDIKGVELEFLSLFESHDLDIEGPGWKVAIGNGIEQVSDGIVWVGGSQLVSLLHCQILYSLISLKRKKPVDPTTLTWDRYHLLTYFHPQWG